MWVRGLPWRRVRSSHDLGEPPSAPYVDRMAEIQIKIILGAADIGQTDQMCRALASMGMTVESTFPEIGVIFGAGDPALLPRMQAMEGVTEAVAEGTMQALKDR